MPKIIFDNGKVVEISQESAEAMASQKKKWEPEVGETYCFLNDDGPVCCTRRIGIDADYNRLVIGNFFQTREEAQLHRQYLAALNQIKSYIWDNDLGVDWREAKKANWWRWYICYDIESDEFFADCNCVVVQFFPLGFLKSEEAAKQLIKAKEDELRVVFGVDK